MRNNKITDERKEIRNELFQDLDNRDFKWPFFFVFSIKYSFNVYCIQAGKGEWENEESLIH